MSPTAAVANPALAAFVAAVAPEALVAQVMLRRDGNGFELRHVADRETAAGDLRLVKITGLRALARFTETGEFRPLKCAPNLVPGWRTVAADAAELGLALDQLYPGGVADWFAARAEAPPVTSYREFTARQSGMYRITAMLDDAGAARVIGACCDPRCCLKRRLWSVPGLAADPAPGKPPPPTLDAHPGHALSMRSAGLRHGAIPTTQHAVPEAGAPVPGKSVIPCLEPCAILLDMARKAVRQEQEEQRGD